MKDESQQSEQNRVELIPQNMNVNNPVVVHDNTTTNIDVTGTRN